VPKRVCAICGKPIERGQRWTMEGGEYYHWECYRAGVPVEEVPAAFGGVGRLQALWVSKLVGEGLPREEALRLTGELTAPLWEEFFRAAQAAWLLRGALEELRALSEVEDIRASELAAKWEEVERLMRQLAEVGVNFEPVREVAEDLERACRHGLVGDIPGLVDEFVKRVESEVLKRGWAR